jgi:serine kinase of HPr protein (carbohydrate metabolism regulator)
MARIGGLPFARLVADDRVFLETSAGRLLARPPEALAGLIEIRGLGIRGLPHEPVATVGLVVDLAAPDGSRYPTAGVEQTIIGGIALPRLAVAPDMQPFPLVLAWAHTQIGGAD